MRTGKITIKGGHADEGLRILSVHDFLRRW